MSSGMAHTKQILNTYLSLPLTCPSIFYMIIGWTLKQNWQFSHVIQPLQFTSIFPLFC